MTEIELSYCVVNTAQRELLVRGLDAIAREREGLPFASEVLVLDNASGDGSAESARAHPAVDEVVALDRRRGKALNDSELLRHARGRYALLLNEDSERRSPCGRHCRGGLARPARVLDSCARTAQPRRAHGAFPPSPRPLRAR
jgi:hypothetical protein